MATKATLISAVNGFLTSVINITKHRNSMLEVINELFPTTINSIDSSGGISWDLKFTKLGNKCHVSGTITNDNNFVIGNTKLLDIPNSIFYPKTTQFGIAVGYLILNNTRISFKDSTFLASPNSIFLLTNLGATNTLVINQTYIVND